MKSRSERENSHVVYGVNVDDLGDYRPGQRAANQHQAEAPLVDAGLTKVEIRELSRRVSLATWDRPRVGVLEPAHPIRTPGDPPANAKTVERGEEEIRAPDSASSVFGSTGDLTRIEIALEELAQALQPGMARAFTAIFKPLGFHYITLDLIVTARRAVQRCSTLGEPARNPPSRPGASGCSMTPETMILRDERAGAEKVLLLT